MSDNGIKLPGFSRKLKMLCSDRGSQARVAKATGLSPAAVNQIVNGHQVPSLLQALLIARALGASLDDLTNDEVIEVEAANAITDADRKLLDIAHIVGIEEALRRITMAPPRPATVQEGTHPRPPVDQTPQVEGHTLADDMAEAEGQLERRRKRPAG